MNSQTTVVKPTYSAEDWNALGHIFNFWAVTEGPPEDLAPGGLGLLGVELTPPTEKRPGKWGKNPGKYMYWTPKAKLEKSLGYTLEPGAEMLMRGRMPIGVFNNVQKNADMMGVVLWHYGLAAIDVDLEEGEDINIKVAMVQRKFGPPLVIIRTGSGGVHMIYPIRRGPLEEAHRHWGMKAFGIEGIKIGEIPCGARYCFIWSPTALWGAIQQRLRMRDSDENSDAKFLNPDLIEWVSPAEKTSKQGSIAYAVGDLPPAQPDFERAKLSAIIKTLALSPSPLGNDRFQGACPGCGGGTRFQAGLYQGRAFAKCFSCYGSTYDHPAFINRIRKDVGFGGMDNSPPEYSESEWLSDIEQIAVPVVAEFMPRGERCNNKALGAFSEAMGIKQEDAPQSLQDAMGALADQRRASTGLEEQIEVIKNEIEEAQAGGDIAAEKKCARKLAYTQNALINSEKKVDGFFMWLCLHGGKYDATRDGHPLLLAHRGDILLPFNHVIKSVPFAICAEQCERIRDWWWNKVLVSSNNDASTFDYPIPDVSEARNIAIEVAKGIGRNYDISETQVRNVLKAPAVLFRFVGGDATSASEVMKAGTRSREEGRLQVPITGDEPNAKARMTSKIYRVRKESPISSLIDRCVADIEHYGGIASPRLLKTEDAQDLAYVIRRSGVKVIFNFMDSCFEITHPRINGWGGGRDCRVSSSATDRLVQLVNLASRNFLTPGKVTGNRRVDVREGEGEFTIESALPGWSANIRTVLMLLQALKGTDVQIVDPMSDWTKSIVAKHRGASPEYLGQCLDLAKNLLLRIDGMRPAEGQEDLAVAAGQVIYATLMTRRLEALSASEKGFSALESQRYVPILYGDKGVAKTTLCKLIVPTNEHMKEALGDLRKDVLKAHGGVFEGRVLPNFNFKKGDGNDALRQMVGKAVVINDELRGMGSADPEDVKELITLTQGEYHAKYENYREIRRSDVFVGTTNKTGSIPVDEALRDRLVMVQMIKQYPEENQTATGMRVARWLASHYDSLFIGGLEMAYMMQRGELTMEPGDFEAIRAHVFDAASNDSINVGERIVAMVADGVFSWEDTQGVKWLSFNRIAREIYTLRYTQDVHIEPMRTDGKSVKGLQSIVANRQNEEIRPDDHCGYSNNHDETRTIHLGDEFSPWMRAAVKARLGSPGRHKRGIVSERDKVLDAMKSVVSETGFHPRKSVPPEVMTRWLNGCPMWEWARRESANGNRVDAIRLDDQVLKDRVAEHLFEGK